MLRKNYLLRQIKNKNFRKSHNSAAEIANLLIAANKACVKRNTSMLVPIPGINQNAKKLSSNVDPKKLTTQRQSLVENLASNKFEVNDIEGSRASAFVLDR